MNNNAGSYKLAASRIAAVIADNHGIESEEISKITGYSLAYTKHALSIVSAARMALPVQTEGWRKGWFPADVAQPMLDAQQAEIAKRRAAVEASRASKQPTRRECIRRLGEDERGVSAKRVRDELGYTANCVGKYCPALIKAGLLFKAERDGAYTRWFTSQERAKAWAAMPPMEPSEITLQRMAAWDKRGRTSESTAVARAQSAMKRAEEKRKAQAAEFERRQQLRQIERQKAEKKAEQKRLEKLAKQTTPAPKKASTDAPVTLKTKATDIRGAVDYSRAKVIVCPSPVSVYRHQYDPTSDAHRAYVRQLEQLRGQA